MIQTKPFELTDFSGGITDHYVNGNLNAYQEADNFIVLNNKTLLQRPGSEVDDVTNAQIPAGIQRIGLLINMNNNSNLLVQSAKKIYFRNPSAYSTLAGPTGNDALSAGSTAAFVSSAQWRGHVLLTNDAFANPVKIYKDGSTLKLRQAGLPYLASNPTITPGAAGANSFLYAFHYHYTYTVGTEEFQDFGPTTIVAVTNSGDPSVNNNAITAIPVIANGGTGNYDTTNIKVYIFRTINGGTTFYKLGEVTNGTTTFTDSYSDATIQTNEIIYTEGGVLDNDPPPLSKFVHVVNNTAYYAYIKDGSEELKTKVMQSVQDDIDSVPADFFDNVDDEITGLSSIQSIPIVLCKRHIYRIEGAFDETGRGFMNHVRISDTAGCISNASVVQAENTLFWAGKDGIYMSDGYMVKRISENINDLYKTFVDSTSDTRRICGTFDEKERRVIWGVTRNSSSLDNDCCLVLDLQWGLSKESCFTTYSGGDSFAPTSLAHFNGKLHRADKRGYVLRHDDALFTDPEINTLTAASTWAKKTIVYNFKTIATNFDGSFLRKWVTRVLLTAKNRSNVSIQINAINDDGKFVRALKPIRYRRNCVWGDVDFSWGNVLFVWNVEGLIEEWRRMPAKGLRCSYMQLQVTNAYIIVANSDTVGNATINTVAKTATLDTAATADWPDNSVGYYLSFDTDNYTNQYLVTAATADTLTFVDSGNTAPGGSRKWLLSGYKKDEFFNLVGLNIHYAALSPTQTTFEAGDSGENSS